MEFFAIALFFIPCYVFVSNLTAAIRRGIKEEEHGWNLFWASAALSVIIVLMLLFFD